MNRALAQAVEAKAWERLPHELKISLQPDDLDKLLAAAMLPRGDAKQRRIWLFDTPDRELAKAGITLRLRQRTKGGDFMVKVRPVRIDRIQGRWLTSRTFELEADIVGGKRLLSASIKRDLEPGGPLEARQDAFDQTLLSPLQRDLLREVAEVELPLEKLRRTRPADVQVWRTGQLVIEHWALPEDGEVLEVSSTVPGDQLQPTRLWLETLLDTAGVRRAKAQATKSERLLRTL